MNKKIYKWLSIFSLTFFLSSCGLSTNQNPTEPETQPPTEETEETPEESNENNQSEDEVNQELTAWLPRLDNVLYSYEGVGNEYATFNRRPQFNQENYYQTTTDNGGTVNVEVFEYKNDEIVQIGRASCRER